VFVPLLLMLAWSASVRAELGVVISGSGAVNLSMGGAATAAPLSAGGALYWNPATMVALPHSELETGAALLTPHTTVSSFVPAGSVFPGLPPSIAAVPAQTFTGSDKGDNGAYPLPNIAGVYKPSDDWAFGIGLLPTGGFGTNYPGSTSNAVLSPRPPLGIAQGPVMGQFQLVDVIAATAVRVTDKLSFGFAPILALSYLQEDPGIGVVPDFVNGIATYPSLTHTHIAFGAGFQVGAYWEAPEGWRFGLSYKSTQWMQDFKYESADPLGQPRHDRIRADFPSVASLGVGYAGLERWVLTGDLRYIDYKNTVGFSQSGFGSNLAVRGLGWRSIFAIALGAQFQATDCVSLRLGYSYNQEPVPDQQAFVNIASETIEQHTLYAGASYNVTENLVLSATYMHVFGNSIQGPVVSPQFGALPGSFVKDEVLGVDVFIAGITVRF
jgi:long-chain fatty acid transport protein